MDPFGPIVGDASWVKAEFAFLIGAGLRFITAFCACDLPPLPQGGVDHRAPYGFIPIFTHGRVRLLQDGKDAGGVRHAAFPLARVSGRQMAGQPFDEGSLFHGSGTPAYSLPFRAFHNGRVAV